MTRRLLGIIPLVLLAALCSVRADEPQAQQPGADALARLKEGNARFVADMPAVRKNKVRRLETADVQKPFAIILTCSDSRVAPELVFDQGIGDLFVVRVAGNVAADPSVLGSLEFAAAQLKVSLIVVLGHDKCGAVETVLKGVHVEGNVEALAKQIYVGDKAGKDEQAKLATAVRANARFQAKALLERSKVVAELVKGERVQVVTGVYHLGTGEVEWLAPAPGKGGK
jgi:carbonic anhydrase